MKLSWTLASLGSLSLILAVNEAYVHLKEYEKQALLESLQERHVRFGFPQPVLIPFSPRDEAMAKGWAAAVAVQPDTHFLPLTHPLRLPGHLVAMPIAPNHEDARAAISATGLDLGEPWVLLTLDHNGKAKQVYMYVHQAYVRFEDIRRAFEQDQASGTLTQILQRFPAFLEYP